MFWLALLWGVCPPLETIRIHGIEIVHRQRYLELVHRRMQKPPRCQPEGKRWRVEIYGWQDKSGDVWVDLANLLLEQGIARKR